MKNVRNDVVGHVFESAVVDNNLLPIDTVSTLSQDFLKVSSVVRIHVDEVHFEIATQGFSAVLIQSVLSGFALFKHDQRCARHDDVVVVECTASGKAIDEIEFEFITRRVHA